MKRLKKLTGMMLAAALVFQLCALHVSAAAARVGYSGNRETVLISFASESSEGSDFVKSFPKELSLRENMTGAPLNRSVVSERQEYDTVPLYLQSDYPDVLYGGGTVETSGSSITALSMLATYLTGYKYLPDEMARWFAGKADEDFACLIYASKALGLPFEASEDWQATFAQVQAGKYAVIQLDQTSVFTDTQHFIVLKGITEDGKILVNDPCADNYLNEALKEGLESGFAESSISTGFRYALIFDKAQVPGDIARYTGIPVDSGNDRYSSIELTLAEKQLLARVVYVNAYGECEEGQQALVEVILNRMLSEDFPNELKEIVYGEEALCEVSLLNEAKPDRAHYLAVEKALYGPYILTEDVTDFSYTCHEY